MRRSTSVVAVVLALALACVAFAESPPTSQPAAAYPALQKRLALLEQENEKLKSENETLKQQLDKLQAEAAHPDAAASPTPASIDAKKITKGMKKAQVEKILGKPTMPGVPRADGSSDSLWFYYGSDDKPTVDAHGMPAWALDVFYKNGVVDHVVVRAGEK